MRSFLLACVFSFALIGAFALGHWNPSPTYTRTVLLPLMRFTTSGLETTALFLIILGLFYRSTLRWDWGWRLVAVILLSPVILGSAAVVLGHGFTYQMEVLQTRHLNAEVYRLVKVDGNGERRMAVFVCNGLTCEQIYTAGYRSTPMLAYSAESRMLSVYDGPRLVHLIQFERGGRQPVIEYRTPAEPLTPLNAEAAGEVAILELGTMGDVLFLPDGDTLAVAMARREPDDWTDSGGVLLYETDTLTLARQLNIRSVESLAYADNLLFGSSHEGLVYIWNTNTYVPRVETSYRYDGVPELSVAGRLIASGGREAIVREFSSASFVRRLAHASYNAEFRVAIRPDAEQAVLGWYPGLTVFDLESGTETQLSTDVPVSALAYAPDGRFIAAGRNSLALFDVEAETRLWWQAFSPQLEDVAFSPDGRLIAAALADGTVRLYVTDSGKLASTLEGHTALVHSIAWHPDGALLASASDDGTVMLWGVE